jgi:diguanylate cyclase (GGDEF)-like protein
MLNHSVKLKIFLVSAFALLIGAIFKAVENDFIVVVADVLMVGIFLLAAFQEATNRERIPSDFFILQMVTLFYMLVVYRSPEVIYLWSYPIVMVYYFLLPHQKAISLNAVLLVWSALITYSILPIEYFARFIVTLSTASVFAYSFSVLVAKQSKILKQQAQTDILTGLSNRRAMEAELVTELSRLKRYKGDSCLMILDIDHFKSINDKFGHAKGDKALNALANIVKQRLRKCDRIFRYGGEEFVIILPNTELQHGVLLAEYFRELVSHTELIDEVNLTISVGVTEMVVGEDWKTCFERADRHLYVAKKQGRNRTVSDKEDFLQIINGGVG